MLKSGIKLKGLIAIAAIFCFMLGFTTATSIHQTNWLGYLVHGTNMIPNSDSHGFKIYPLQDHNDVPIVGEPSYFSPSVVDSIVIGLREDGVVVWKKADELEK